MLALRVTRNHVWNGEKNILAGKKFYNCCKGAKLFLHVCDRGYKTKATTANKTKTEFC